MKKLFILVITTFVMSSLFAQSLSKVFCVEGGNYGVAGNQVYLSYFYPLSGSLLRFDSISGDFTNDMLIHDSIAYVHIGNADASLDKIYRYNINSCPPERLNSTHVKGLLRMYYQDGKLIVSRAFGADSQFVQILDAQNLSLIANINEANEECQGISGSGDTIFVAMRGSWPNFTSAGKILLLNASTNSYLSTITLDTFAKQVNEVYAHNGKLWCVTANDILTEYDLATSSYINHSFSGIANSGGIYNNNLLVQTDSGNGYIDLGSLNFDTSSVPQTYWDLAKTDQISGNVYTLATDWSTGIATISNGNTEAELTAYPVFDFVYENLSSPMASNYSVALQADQDTLFNVLDNSNACAPDFISWISMPMITGSIAEITADNKIYYRPAIGVAANDTLYYRICNENGVCSEAYIAIHIYDPVSVAETNNNLMTVYPNPSSDKIYLQFMNTDIKSVELRDALSRLVQKTTSNQAELMLDLQEITDGIYYLDVIDSKSVHYLQKVVKK